MSNDDISGLPDVDFDFAAATALQNAARNSATSVQESVDVITSSSQQALKDFNGHFADIFRDNVATAQVDGQNIVTCLKALARYCGELITAAQDENQRRSHARAWLEEKRSLTLGLRGDSSAPSVPDEPMPYDIDETGPSYSVQDLSLKSRAEPVRGNGGGGMSSAVPANLKKFSTEDSSSGRGIFSFGGSYITNLPTLWSSFQSGCRWGQLTDGGVCNAVGKWFTANSADMRWMGEVAAAFEAAGGSETGVTSVSNTALQNALKSAGVSEVRLGIDVSPPTLQGVLPTTGYSNDPVNTATGNFIEPERDLAFEGIASRLSLTRMYNSMDESSGVFGLGWSSPLDARLEFEDETTTFVMADGRHIVFPKNRSGASRAEHANFWLDEEPAAHFARGAGSAETLLVVRDNQGGWWTFAPSGQWLAHGAGPGTVVEAVRDEHGHVTLLRHEFGQQVQIDYEDGLVRNIRSSDQRLVSYDYDAENRLVSATNEAGTRTYRWNSAGLIDQVVAATGVVECINTYDESGRVITQRTEFGRVVRFAYLPGRVTAVSDEDGTNSNTWIADRRGRLIGIIDTNENRQSMSYDAHGNLVSVMERDGSITSHLYDDRGRRIRTVTPEGADTRYRYDDLDRIIETQTGETSITRFEYANSEDRLPSRIIDPLGGVTRLRWDGGLLREAADPTGIATRFEYDKHGGLISVSDAMGNTAYLIRDAAGRVLESTTPTGNRTRWQYDAAGNVTRRIDADGSTWNFAYGSGGKLTAQIDPYGARTLYEYGPHGELIRMTDPLGRVTEQAYDTHGNLTALTLPDGTEWMFKFDGLSRLGTVTDPQGGVWEQKYDPNGRLVSRTDPTGVRREFTYDRIDRVETLRTAFSETVTKFDEFGRPTKVTKPDEGASVTVYDLCGRVVEEVDAEGGLTRYERDAAGRVTRRISPAGRETRFEYDACGRPSAMIDGLGARTELRYDADSRIVEKRLPNGDITEVEYDPMGRIISERVPGRGVSRHGYDLAGRLVFAQDTQYGIRKFTYDAAGQLTSTINGLGGKTTYTYDDLGRVITITDPDGAVTRREYTSLNQVRSSTDPLGRTTTAKYDAAGRLLTQIDPDGNELHWEYDTEGHVQMTWANDRKLAESKHDHCHGIERVIDYTRPDGVVMSQAITRDRLGRIIERSRGRETTTWAYDPDGLRSYIRTPNGDEAYFDHDGAGRLISIRHSAFGEIAYTYDPAGNMMTAVAANTSQSWRYRNGFSIEHEKLDASGVCVTTIERDESGRILRLVDPNESTSYAYDNAEQLILAEGEVLREWEFDLSGRLVCERFGSRTVEYSYDIAGQLTRRTSSDGEMTEYRYDGAGRRILESGESGVRRFTWDERGWLRRVTTDSSSEELWVDALGELSEIGSERLSWDTAATFPVLNRVGDRGVFAAPGFTGIGREWQPVGWRPARATRADDPWKLVSSPEAGSTGIKGFSITGHGTPIVAGLEWVGARTYDPIAHGFLSVDPLSPVLGAGWAGNPYSYAGNDPLQAFDPHGRSPITDQDLINFTDPVAEWWEGLRSWAQSNDGKNWSFWLSTAGIALPIISTRIPHPVVIGIFVAAGYLASIASTGIDCLAAPNSPACIIGSIGISTGPAGAIFSRIPNIALTTAESVQWVAKIMGWNADAVTWIPALAEWWERELW